MQNAAAILLASIIAANDSDSCYFFEEQFPYRVPAWFKKLHPVKIFDEEAPVFTGDEVLEKRIREWKADPRWDLINDDIEEFYSKEIVETLRRYENDMEDFWKRRDEHGRYEYLIQFRKWLKWLVDFTNFNQDLNQDLTFSQTH